MGYELILTDTRGDGPRKTGLITLNRPKQLNALNDALMDEVGAALAAFDADDTIGCIVITGSEKAFAAGADIAAMATATYADVLKRDFITRNWETIRRIRKPVIAAVAGFALGGGCELAMACDFILASDNAAFGQPEVGLGLIPGFGGTQRLARVVGRAIAKQMIFTGEIIKAQRALEIGLANAVYPSTELLGRAREIARAIASKGPLAVGAAKRSLNRGYDLTLEVGMEFEAMLFGSMFKTDDMREGTRAFLEKRAADFKGK